MRRDGRAHQCRDLLVVGGPCGEAVGGGAPFRGVQPVEEVPLDHAGGLVFRDAGEDVRAGGGARGPALHIGHQLAALALDHGQQGVEGLPVQLDREMGIGGTQPAVGIGEGGAGQVLARRMGQGDGRLILQHPEGGGDAGLDGETPQQLFAEGVDGLDLQPAGRLQRAGEQATGVGQIGGLESGGVAAVKKDQIAGQFLVVHDGPAAQLFEQPRLHLGGGGLGVGDAQDLGRARLLQQQPGHPVHKGGGLARAGVGRDEDRTAGIGGGPLVGAGLFEGRQGHSGASSSPPTTCHSQTRARWS